jgi:subtilisin family serine protease
MFKKKSKGFKLPPHEYKSVITTLSQQSGWGISQTKIPSTWKVTQGEGETVMVIDTGWSDHKDLGDNCQKGISVVSGSKIDDKEGHGTHCAGVIAAKNNSTGMVGVAPKATVIAVKALGDNGSGSYAGVAKALEYAIETKPSVVSMSLGSPTSTKRIETAIKKLYDMGIPVVCAAGNDGSAGVDYPGKYPETIAIAAYDNKGNIGSFSAIGEEVDFAAPGVNIYSTYLKHRYAVLSGTSMACPFVSGVIALLLAKHKKQEAEGKVNDCRTVEEIRQHLLKYTIDKGYVGKDNKWGYGLLDVENMILAKNDPELNLPVFEEPTPEPEPTPKPPRRFKSFWEWVLRLFNR